MKTLTYLVPVDFTPCSLNALQYAIMLARHAEGKVVLTHVVDLEQVPESDNPVVVSWSLDRLSISAQLKMKSLREMISLEGVPVEEDIVVGQVKQGIIKQIEKVKPTVVVLGRNTEGEPGKHSMLSHISGNTRIPVLVVPGSHNPRVPNKAMLATDMKSFSFKDYSPLINIIRKTAQQLTVLQVADASKGSVHAKVWIERFNSTFDFEASLVSENCHPDLDIEEAVRNNKVDFLCAVQQQGLLERIFNIEKLPSVVQASVPVLLVRK